MRGTSTRYKKKRVENIIVGADVWRRGEAVVASLQAVLNPGGGGGSGRRAGQAGGVPRGMKATATPFYLYHARCLSFFFMYGTSGVMARGGWELHGGRRPCAFLPGLAWPRPAVVLPLLRLLQDLAPDPTLYLFLSLSLEDTILTSAPAQPTNLLMLAVR